MEDVFCINIPQILTHKTQDIIPEVALPDELALGQLVA